MNDRRAGHFVHFVDFDKQRNGVKRLIQSTNSDNDDRLYWGPFCIT